MSCALSAQTSVVSPVGYGTKEGNSNNTFPFYDIFRYMQLHGDLKGKPRLIKGQSFRRDGRLGRFSLANARTLEIEVWIGEGDLSKISSTYPLIGAISDRCSVLVLAPHR